MIDEETIQAAVGRLLRAAPGSRVIVFGSHARGKADRRSDVDFLVIEPEAADRFAEMVRLRAALRPLPIAADVIVESAEEFEYWKDTPNTLPHRALKEGRVYEQVTGSELTEGEVGDNDSLAGMKVAEKVIESPKFESDQVEPETKPDPEPSQEETVQESDTSIRGVLEMKAGESNIPWVFVERYAEKHRLDLNEERDCQKIANVWPSVRKLLLMQLEEDLDSVSPEA